VLWPAAGAATLLVPAWVWSGQAWRLVTWAFLTPDPISLVFGCLLIGSLGADLCQVWGRPRLVTLYLLAAALPGGLTTLLAAALPPSWLMGRIYASPWVAIDALIIAWASYFPNRPIRLFLVLPAAGRSLIWLTVGITALFAVFQGWQLYLPHALSQGLTLLYLYRLRLLRSAWLRLRLRVHELRLRRRARHLTVVRRDDDRRPPTYH
jgi:membrane associated rhomboid family serine protease